MPPGIRLERYTGELTKCPRCGLPPMAVAHGRSDRCFRHRCSISGITTETAPYPRHNQSSAARDWNLHQAILARGLRQTAHVELVRDETPQQQQQLDRVLAMTTVGGKR
jgi:hypothetical protein